MGDARVSPELQGEELRRFTTRLLEELRALEEVLAAGMVQSEVGRIGAEQEVFLVDAAGRPAPVAEQILEALGDSHFTTELGRFNLEMNLDPLLLGGDCLARLEDQLERLLVRAREAARAQGADLVLTGILPTLHKSDLGLDNMSPAPRYRALNDALGKLRGGPYELRIEGIDELIVRHDSVMLEACNTSFQVHFQVDPAEFARSYNAAQLAAGPVLAAAVNSPLLFGRRLWQETRIAVFQQAMDTRTSGDALREIPPRVSFGTEWVRESVLEIFREDVARFRPLVAATVEEDPFDRIRRGEPPLLPALLVHNSTVYRWNRPCYGVTDGHAHLRIENRMLPSGPTALDEVANAAFWLGLVAGLTAEYGDVAERIDFADAKSNFSAAARYGLATQLAWLDGRNVPAEELIVHQLLPLARGGLRARGVQEADLDRYLGVIEERVVSGRTGARWLLESLASMEGRGTAAERLGALTCAAVARQWEGAPVHHWPPARLDEAGSRGQHYATVEQFMTTDLLTVRQDEPVELAAQMMEWRGVAELPVEDTEGRLVGLVSFRALLRLLANGAADDRPLPVSAAMTPNPATVTPETATTAAIDLMRGTEASCLPVVQGGRLVGVVTERDFLHVASAMLESAERPKT